jgi:hypothetical protein
MMISQVITVPAMKVSTSFKFLQYLQPELLTDTCYLAI